MISRRAALFVVPLAAFLLIGCDQIGSRYELSKDQKGRTLRLDKRTGEIAIIEDDKIVSLKDAKDIEHRQKEASDRVGKFKYWPAQDLEQFKIRVNLTAVWRDGQMLYSIAFRPAYPGLAKKGGFTPIEKDNEKKGIEKDAERKDTEPKLDAEKVIRGIANRRFDLILEDAPFQLAREQLRFSIVVDKKGKYIGQDAKGQIPMSRETYEKIDVWTIQWY